MTSLDYADLKLGALRWNETAQISYAELTGADGEMLHLDLDSLDAVELLRLSDQPKVEDGRVHKVLVELLVANGYKSEAIFFALDENAKVRCHLLYQKENLPGFLELRPGDGLVISVLLGLPVRAHRFLLMSFVDRGPTTVG